MKRLMVKGYVDVVTDDEEPIVAVVSKRKAAEAVERSFRLPPDVAVAIEQLGEQEQRSMNNMAAVLLREALTARGWWSQTQTG